MSARPVLFNGAMVRAILAGAKTQTRRVVKPQPPNGCGYAINGAQSAAVCAAVLPSGEPVFVPPTPRSKDHLLLCPLGAPGDDLWVRETWARRTDVDPATNAEKAKAYLRFAADDNDLSGEWHDYGGKWRPSIHMPRWASRLTLRVTSVRVERLREITEDDARAEGVLTLEPRAGAASARERFADLWSDVYGRASWDANPWVWVVSFEREGGAT